MTDENNSTDDAIVAADTEAVTASVPDRSAGAATTGVTSASEEPDASASEPSSTASEKPDASASEPSSTEHRPARKVREGVVVSNAMDKTAVVAVIERVRHPKYNKFVLQTKRLYVHDKTNDVNVGDKVRVMETRPLSKSKRWRVTDVLERAK